MSRYLLSGLVASAVVASCAAGEIVLSERGRPCAISAPDGASYQYAAEEFRDWVKEITGVAPIIASNDSVRSSCRVVLQKPDVDSDLGDEGFRIVTKGDALTITGGIRGILYGVYEVLETYGGIGWYASWRTVVPKRNRFTIPDGLNVVQKPAFKLRARSWFDVSQNPDFACRLRMNGAEHYGKPGRFEAKHGGTGWRIGHTGSCHTLGELVPAWKYGKAHPEYFAELNGVRRISEVQPCLTNPDVLEIATSNLFERIRQDVDAPCFDVSQNDYDNYCTCAKCRAVDEAEGSHSGTMLRFVNAVAERVEREFPDKMVCTLAYRYTRHPPKITRPRHNVLIRLCSIECDYSAPIGVSRYRENLSLERDLAGWAEISPHLYVWDYATNFRNFLHTFPNAKVMLANMRTYRKAGVEYMLEQGNSLGLHSDFGELKVWLIAKGMWNPDRPLEPLVDRFMRGYYGAAAPYAKAVYDLLYAEPKDTEHVPALIYEDPWDRRRISDAQLEKAAKLWQQAEEAAKDDPECLRNVRMSAAGVDASRLERMLLGVKRFWVTRQPERFAIDGRLPDLLKRMQNLRREEPKLLMSESKGRNEEIVRRWDDFRMPGVVKPADSIVIAADDLELEGIGKFGRYEDDPKADGGRAVAVWSSHYGWCLRFRMRDLAYDDATYRVKVRVRARKTGVIGEAFYAGLYDETQRVKNISNCRFKAEEMPDEYTWYDLGTLRPTDKAIFWFSSAKPPAPGKRLAAKVLFVNSISITRE